MGGGFQFIDIILFALIAVFFIFRLRRALGRRDGHEQPHPFNRAARGDGDRPGPGQGRSGQDGDAGPQPDGNVVALPGREPETGAGPEPAGDGGAPEEGLAAVCAADQSFDPDEFLAGARAAFDMILGAFAAGDRRTLKNLLSAEVFADFERALSERERAGRAVEHTMVGVNSAEIVEASVKGREASVTVKFVSEQINVTRSEDGGVVEGDPEKIIKAADYWTFARNVRARDPNWSLIATASGE